MNSTQRELLNKHSGGYAPALKDEFACIKAVKRENVDAYELGEVLLEARYNSK